MSIREIHSGSDQTKRLVAEVAAGKKDREAAIDELAERYRPKGFIPRRRGGR